jgi:hypothetical protein
MKTVFFLLTVLHGHYLQAHSPTPGNTHLFRNAVIEELKFVRAPLDEVIAFLREETRQGDTQVNFIIPYETKASERMVTLDLKNVNAVDAFATILKMTGTRAEMKQNMVWILPDSD